jgi:hypothetical protein
MINVAIENGQVQKSMYLLGQRLMLALLFSIDKQGHEQLK